MIFQVYLWRSMNNLPDAQPTFVSSVIPDKFPPLIKVVSQLGERSIEQNYEYTNLTWEGSPLYAQVLLPTSNNERQP
jgi:hypothetical protein